MKDFTQILGDNFRFRKTSWTLVRAARDVEALGALITAYWKPLYFFVRQQGFDNETAKDIVQAFLLTLVERDALSKADPIRGRFRTFLLAALTNFIKDWSKSASREKRGGGKAVFSLDFAAGEAEYRLEVPSDETPEAALSRAWARGVWKQALSELKGDPAHLEAFKLYLDDVDYPAICAKTGLSESAAKTAIHRLKAQLRRVIVSHIQRTVDSEEDLNAEIGEFMSLLGRKSPR